MSVLALPFSQVSGFMLSFKDRGFHKSDLKTNETSLAPVCTNLNLQFSKDSKFLNHPTCLCGWNSCHRYDSWSVAKVFSQSSLVDDHFQAFLQVLKCGQASVRTNNRDCPWNGRLCETEVTEHGCARPEMELIDPGLWREPP